MSGLRILDAPLERFVFVTDQSADIQTVEDAPRKCRMRMLRGGEPALADSRRFRMTPEDRASTLGNAQRRLAVRTIPLLFEHGFGPCGGKAGGKVTRVYEDAEDLWAEVLLDEDTFEEAVDPGLNWHGRSAGFMGWMDEDGFIHPADVFELSLTNFPAMEGLGAVEAMHTFSERFAARSTTPAQAPASVTVSSAAAASKPKEQEMSFSPEFLSSLGLADNASAEDVQRAVTVRAAEATPCPACGMLCPSTAAYCCGCGGPMKKGASLSTRTQDSTASTAFTVDVAAQLRAILASERAENDKAVQETLKSEREAFAKKQAVDAFLASAPGKITAANRDAWRKAAESDLETAKALLADARAVVPVAGAMPAFTGQPGNASGAAASGVTVDRFGITTDYHERSEYLTKVARFAKRAGFPNQAAASEYLRENPAALAGVQ